VRLARRAPCQRIHLFGAAVMLDPKGTELMDHYSPIGQPDHWWHRIAAREEPVMATRAVGLRRG